MRLDRPSNVEEGHSILPNMHCNRIHVDKLLSWGDATATTSTAKRDSRLSPNGEDISRKNGSASGVGCVPRYKRSPFPISTSVNSRFILWDGDITELEVDAITNVTNESLDDTNIISERILAKTGDQVKHDLMENIQQCRVGDVCVTKGYNLPAPYILHTVAPTFIEKFKTAAENTLHCCYRNVLCKARELQLYSLALCNVSSNEKSFPVDVAAHIALRTIRRFLEKYNNPKVVFCIGANERGVYEVLAPLYFPRDTLEERSALWQLPKDIGGEYGEPVYPDRQIRIIRNPQHSVLMPNGDEDSDTTEPVELESGISDLDYSASDLSASRVPLNNYGHEMQSSYQGDLDRQHLLGNRTRHRPASIRITGPRINPTDDHERYERLLERAQIEDLAEVSGIGCLYQSGVDRLGRPVVVFCGKWFPANNLNLEKALMYLIKLLDPIVKGDYVVAYFHTLTSANNYPSLHWLREVYTVLPYKYKKNLKAFYIVHPTFWTKMMTWWFTTFMAPAIKAKVHSLPGVEYLYSAISKSQLEIPAYITEYDMTINGLHYFTPVLQTSTS